MPEYTQDQTEALRIAHNLVDAGIPVFSAYRNHSLPLDHRMPFLLPNGWQQVRPSHGWIDRWQPGMALCMVTGVVADALDTDPRNNGEHGWQHLHAAGALPRTFGQAETPSAGWHHLIRRTHLTKGKPADGIDLQAGDDRGEGRAFIFIAPTVRVSRHGPNFGKEVAYRWSSEPNTVGLLGTDRDEGMDRLVSRITAGKPAVVGTHLPTTGSRVTTVRSADHTGDSLFDDAATVWTETNANRLIDEQLLRVQDAKRGEVNGTLGGAARVLGRFVIGGFLTEADAAERLKNALELGNVHSDAWNVANGLGWTADMVIGRAFALAAAEPWEVGPDVTVEPAEVIQSGWPKLLVESAATMSYWLAEEAGRGRLSGFFLRDGQVVHTPRVCELGYVPAKEGDNGPAEIRPVTGDVMAAKIQFLYACYKTVKVKGTDDTREVPALFPVEAAKKIVNAPEAGEALRPLRGITHTPIVAADGSVLTTPGYDEKSGYLFLPDEGVDVPAVPDMPTPAEVETAVTLLHSMVEGFPFTGDDDRANYFALLLTPLLRLVAPPPYKMFGISAHQPGSGKTLLAEIAGLIHGSVMRSEVPQEEAEWGKLTTSLLSTTSTPLVVLDNVKGVVGSSHLAGLLTASGELRDRELGSNTRTTTVRNDRLWVMTGNNLSLGGDLVRRAVTIYIDPDMARPESRTDFRITDLKGWVREHRNQLLHALLTMVRYWVGQGMPLGTREQSDGFAAWERAVAGILASCGVAGEFDARSGERAASGGDDDGLTVLLAHLHARFGSGPWTVAKALSPEGDAWIEADRDWLPSVVLDRLARSEARGKQSFGKWLRYRIGRWVTSAEGVNYTIRDGGLQAGTKVQMWHIEVRQT